MNRIDLDWIEGLIVTGIVIIFGATVWIFYNSNQETTIELKKNEWECVNELKHTVIYPLFVGNIATLHPKIITE